MSNFKSTLNRVLTPINSEGYTIIIIALIIAFIAYTISDFLGCFFFVLALFCVYFFRDPVRVQPTDINAIIAPADGVVDAIVKIAPPEELELNPDLDWTRVSIFLSVFNVHIQRTPVAGKITKTHYREGKFFNVSNDKYSQFNERQSNVITTEDGIDIPVIQIAGLIARRIVSNLDLHKTVERGYSYGLIKFGSRVDIYLPNGIEPIVQVGQTMIGGETVIANFNR